MKLFNCAIMVLAISGCAINNSSPLIAPIKHRQLQSVIGTPPAPAISKVPMSVGLEWNAGPRGFEPVSYSIYCGTEPGKYSTKIQVGNVTTATVDGVDGGVKYYFAVTATNAKGFESQYSNEASAYIPLFLDLAFVFNTSVSNVVVQCSFDLVNWRDCPSTPINGVWRVTPDAAYSQLFYRARADGQ